MKERHAYRIQLVVVVVFSELLNILYKCTVDVVLFSLIIQRNSCNTSLKTKET